MHKTKVLTNVKNEGAENPRRTFIKFGATSIVLAGSLARAASQCLGVTPAQTEGPFYPIQDQADKDWDLVVVKGRSEPAKGEIIFLEGQVLDGDCAPVGNALVEIWQACSSGKYNHPNDPNPEPLDPNFQYWGQSITDASGNYMFRTIKPGAYPADETWWRPPHIHVKIHKRSFVELTTQLYFADEKFNDADKILQKLPEDDRIKVVKPIVAGRVRFDVTLKKA